MRAFVLAMVLAGCSFAAPRYRLAPAPTAHGFDLDATIERVGLGSTNALQLRVRVHNHAAGPIAFDQRVARVKTGTQTVAASQTEFDHPKNGRDLALTIVDGMLQGMAEGDRRLKPGATRTVDIDFPDLQWRDGTWCVVLGGTSSEPLCAAVKEANLALDLGDGFAAPIPLLSNGPELVPIEPSSWGFSARLGGGPGITRRGVAGGLGGLELAYGWRGKYLGVSAITRLGFGTVAGLDVQLQFPLKLGTLRPSLGYGITTGLDDAGFLIGHGPRFGMTWLLSVDAEGPFSKRWRVLDWGPFVNVTPVFAFKTGAPLVAGVWTGVEVGVVLQF